VLERTAGKVRLWPATLYGTLKKLMERGFNRRERRSARRRKWTMPGGATIVSPRFGRRVLSAESQRLRELVKLLDGKQLGEVSMSTQDAAVGDHTTLSMAGAGRFPRSSGGRMRREMVQVSEDVVRDVARRANMGGIPSAGAASAGRPGDSGGGRNIGSNWARTIAYGARMLRRSRGFTAVAVCSRLAVGIGMCVSIYSQLESLIFRQIPEVTDPKGLVRIRQGFSFPNYEYFRDHSAQFFAGGGLPGSGTFCTADRHREPEDLGAPHDSELF